MTFSSRNNPRIAASPVALTSLGAVGGARGTAAGALRVLVEFLTQYDRRGVAELENDLRQVDHAQNNSAIAEEKRQRRLTQVRNSLAEAERVVRGKLNTELRSDLRRIEELEASRSKRNRDEGARERQRFNAAAKSLGLTQSEITLLTERARLRKEESVLTARQERADASQLQRARQRAAIESQIGKIQQARASLAPRLAGLAVGAVGGIVGGAVLGVGFALADQAIQKLGDSLQDLIDPARHARDAINELGEAVVELAKNDDLTLLEAAAQKAEELGRGADQATIKLLEQFAAQKLVSDSAKEYIQFLTATKDAESLRTRTINELKEALIRQSVAEGQVVRRFQIAPGRAGGPPSIQRQRETVEQRFLNDATRLYNQLLAANTAEINQNAAARQRLADATAFARLQQDALNDAIQSAAQPSLNAIDRRISALSDVGPSRRTQQLEAALERAQSGGGSSNAAELRNIAEEKNLLLLRQRLKLLGTSINLEKYSGKFLLEAINAKIEAINKEAAAQDRLNRLLDIQFRESQQIRRQSGESVQDFLERRAQENRHLLADRRDLEREALLEQLNDLRDNVQTQVQLQELAERRREALRQQGVNNHIKALQKQLEASRKADRQALEDKRKALEKEREGIQKKVNEAIKLANFQAIEETKAAIRGADSLENLAVLSGRIAGLKRAKATIQGLVQGFGIPAALAKPFIDQINQALSAYESRQNELQSFTNRMNTGMVGGLQHGGVFMLNGGSSPFGQNVRVGEAGQEIGVVLSNKVTQALRQNGGGAQQIGPFNIGRSDDWRRDKYELRKTVEEAVATALRK